jgi:heme exporter protein A
VRLDVDNLACRRSGRRIFAGLSFALEPGGALAVTGRNGAGKSSLLAILCGRLRPDAGRITVMDVGEATLPECLHAVGHRDGLKSALTAGENLTFARDLLGAPRLTPQAALERLGLGHAHDLPVAYLSAGQRRRVALARLLVCARPLWLLDEPTAALDVASQEVLAGLMAEHRAGGGLVIAATHQALGLTDAMELRIAPGSDEPPPTDEGWEDWT